MGLDGSTCSECLPVVTCDFEPPEHVPRTSTMAPTCAVVFGRAPCVPRSREHEKRPAAGREKNAHVQKNIFIHRNILCLTSLMMTSYFNGCGVGLPSFPVSPTYTLLIPYDIIFQFYDDVLYMLLLYRFALTMFPSWTRWVEMNLFRAGHQRLASTPSERRKWKHALGWYLELIVEPTISSLVCDCFPILFQILEINFSFFFGVFSDVYIIKFVW